MVILLNIVVNPHTSLRHLLYIPVSLLCIPVSFHVTILIFQFFTSCLQIIYVLSTLEQQSSRNTLPVWNSTHAHVLLLNGVTLRNNLGWSQELETNLREKSITTHLVSLRLVWRPSWLHSTTTTISTWQCFPTACTKGRVLQTIISLKSFHCYEK